MDLNETGSAMCGTLPVVIEKNQGFATEFTEKAQSTQRKPLRRLS
jgi:hypothetical protein